MRRDIRIIALDLDGTLLNSKKELTPRCAAALHRAAEAGIEIVPTTGRFFGAMPEAVRQLPFLRYAITINGAAVFDVRRGDNIAKAELPPEKAARIMAYLDTCPVIYDCYLENAGFMTRAYWERAEEYAPNAHYLDMIRRLRKPVPELREFVLARGSGVQKVQAFAKEVSVQQELLATLGSRFEGLSVTSSVERNIEINDAHANKGEALLALAAYLGMEAGQTMALGDGLNDISMLRLSGLGVAMANSHPDALAAADETTESCDADGAALAIERLLDG